MAPVVSPLDHVTFGQVLTDAGVPADRLTAVVARVEQLALQAAQSVALGAVQALAEELTGVHRATALEIERQLLALNPGGGVLGLHNKCAQIARNVSRSRPNLP